MTLFSYVSVFQQLKYFLCVCVRDSLEVGVRRQDSDPHGEAASLPTQHVCTIRLGDDCQPGLRVYTRTPKVLLLFPDSLMYKYEMCVLGK